MKSPWGVTLLPLGRKTMVIYKGRARRKYSVSGQTLIKPSFFNSTISKMKSDLIPCWSNFIFPVRPVISTCVKSLKQEFINSSHSSRFPSIHSFVKYGRTCQFHIVDEWISMLPGFWSITAERPSVDILRVIQIVEGPRKQMDGIVYQSGFSLSKQSGYVFDILKKLNTIFIRYYFSYKFEMTTPLYWYPLK